MEGFARSIKQHTNGLAEKTRQLRAPAMADRTPHPSTCTHCAGPLSKDLVSPCPFDHGFGRGFVGNDWFLWFVKETSSWTVGPLIRDSFSMIGSSVGGIASAFYGFNHAMPIVRRWVKGPMWIHFLVGAPPVIVFSSACAGLAGGALPAVAQLVSSSCHAVMSSSSMVRSSPQEDSMRKRSSSPL